MTRTVIVLAKVPRPGRVKTRLCPPLTFDEATEVAWASLHDTLDAVRRTRCDRRILAVDDPSAGLTPWGFDVIGQSAGGLDRRLASAFAAARGPTVLVGMDTPQITAELVEAGLESLLAPRDAVIGPAADGGYWLIGLPGPDARVFTGIPMSTEETGAAQRTRLLRLGYRVTDLPVLRDVDEHPDALAVAAEINGTRFAETVARITMHTMSSVSAA